MFINQYIRLLMSSNSAHKFAQCIRLLLCCAQIQRHIQGQQTKYKGPAGPARTGLSLSLGSFQLTYISLRVWHLTSRGVPLLALYS